MNVKHIIHPQKRVRIKRMARLVQTVCVKMAHVQTTRAHRVSRRVHPDTPRLRFQQQLMEQHAINVVLLQRFGMDLLALAHPTHRNMLALAHVRVLRVRQIKTVCVRHRYIQHVKRIVKTENLQPRVHFKIVEIQQQHLN